VLEEEYERSKGPAGLLGRLAALEQASKGAVEAAAGGASLEARVEKLEKGLADNEVAEGPHVAGACAGGGR